LGTRRDARCRRRSVHAALGRSNRSGNLGTTSVSHSGAGPAIFGYFLLVLIGVELLETLKAYVKRDVIHVRVVLEVALIAMARKVIIEEPNAVPSLTLFGIAALILALGVAFYFERQAKRESEASPGRQQGA
jgi:uncharacterized membrane protein (DUF373 family)